MTVDTAHVLVTAATTRENLYVSMTRGRELNKAWVIIDQPGEAHHVPHPDDLETKSARTVLAGVLANVGAEPSAHQSSSTEAKTWGGMAQLAVEYETILDAAMDAHWAKLVHASTLGADLSDRVLASPEWWQVARELSRGLTNGHPTDRMLTAAINKGIGDDVDPAIVISQRLAAINGGMPPARSRRPRQMLVGLLPEPVVPLAADMEAALNQRRAAIIDRAKTLAKQAITERQPWLAEIGPRPTDSSTARRWTLTMLAAVAFRDRYGITGPTLEPASDAAEQQRQDAARVRQLIRQIDPPKPLHEFGAMPAPKRDTGLSL